MAYIPSYDTYSRSGNGRNGSTAIINGRRVNIGQGMQQNELQTLCGGPGRRPVKISGGRAETMEPKSFYSPQDFCDSKGNPCKISSIPDRTKGDRFSGERVLIFLDFANIDAGSRSFGALHYGDLLSYLGEGRFVVEAYAYVPIDPRRPEGRRDLVRHLQENGWMVTQKVGKIAGNSYKSNVNVEMCMDMVDSAHQIRPDIIVLCSGDGDFLPVVRRLRKMGIRTEVAAFEKTADSMLPYEASGFISLDVWQNGLETEPSGEKESLPYTEEDSEPEAKPHKENVFDILRNMPQDEGVALLLDPANWRHIHSDEGNDGHFPYGDAKGSS